MIMKQSSSLLRVIGFSAGLVASAAMMSSVHAATSATITATGTVPVACSVSGANITMAKVDSLTLRGEAKMLLTLPARRQHLAFQHLRWMHLAGIAGPHISLL